MTKKLTPIEVGDRFESKDKRDRLKVVEVVYAGPERSHPGSWRQFVIRTEVHESNPGAVGRRVWVSAQTLHTRYRRVSR